VSKHAPGSYGLIREGELMLEWNEQENRVAITNTGVKLTFSYDGAGTMWRMLSYLLVPTGATGKYT
jgi:hypothetical protein